MGGILIDCLLLVLFVLISRANRKALIYADQVNEELQIEKSLLENSNQELEHFAYVASHDLKSPLRAIDNLASWVIEDLGEDIPEASKRHLALMRERIGRLEGLLDDLLHYSRAGRLQYEKETVAVGKLVGEIVDLYAESTLHFEIAPDLPVIDTQKPPFQQVLQNLISNAIKYHDKKEGKVTVGWEDAGSFFRFWVADDGPGIAPEFHERVFQMFQKLQSRDEVAGTGIGLALVKKAVESYGGEVLLISDIEQGARFEFTWPKYIALGGTDE